MSLGVLLLDHHVALELALLMLCQRCLAPTFAHDQHETAMTQPRHHAARPA
jgi:hypothetical protein